MTLRSKIAAAFLLSVLGLPWALADEPAAPATNLFQAAETAFNASNYQGALKNFTQVEMGAPQTNWPRKYRHLLALTYYNLGQLAQAVEIWGRMECECRNDELGFRVGYNLALAQQALGQTALAYATLTAMPADLMLHEPPGNLKVYFELAGQLATSLGYLDSAASVYLSALSTFPDAPNRRYFSKKFCTAVDGIRSREELTDLMAHTPVGTARKYVAGKLRRIRAPARGTATQAQATPAVTNHEIVGLKVAPLVVQTVPLSDGSGHAQRLQVVGQFRQPGWQLYCGGMKIEPNTNGKFEFSIDIFNQAASAPFFAVGPQQHIQGHLEEYAMKDWGQFRAPASASDLVPETAVTVSSPKETEQWNVFLTPAFGIAYIAFNEPGTATFDATSPQVRVSAGIQPPGWNWILTGEARYQPTQLGPGASVDKQTYFEAGGEIGYRFSLGSPQWLLDLNAGAMVTSLYDANNTYGFRDAKVATLRPVLRWRFSDDSEVDLSVRGGLFVNQPPSPTLNRRLVSVGLSWSSKLGWVSLAPGVQADFFHLEAAGQTLTASQGLFELAIGF